MNAPSEDLHIGQSRGLSARSSPQGSGKFKQKAVVRKSTLKIKV